MEPSGFLYVALGDSTGVGVGASDAQGYVSRLFARIVRVMPSARLTNLCVSGATTSTVRQAQLPRVPPRGADLASLLVGANDLWFGTPAGTSQNLAHLSAALRARVHTTLLCTLPNLVHAPAARLASPSQRSLLTARLGSLNELLRELARKDGHVLVDLERIALADRPHFFSADGFHPSAEGYQALADELWRALDLEARTRTRTP